MKYRYQFLLDLYRNRTYHSENSIWLYRYEHISQNGHYLKVYLYGRNKYQQLEEVTFGLHNGDTIQSVSIKEFHKIKQHYQPYLIGCIIPLDNEIDIDRLEIISYEIDGKAYDFMSEDIEIILTDEQKNQARNALLHQQMDITIMPSIQDSYDLCACGYIHRTKETCPNCHRPYSEIQKLVEKGQEALCKEALLKKYCRLSELEKRNYKTDQWISDIQKEATDLQISCTSDDYASFLKQAASTHRKDIVKTVFLSISCALGLAFGLLFLIGMQSSLDDLDDNILPNDSLYSSYGDNDSYEDDSDIDNLYSYHDSSYKESYCSLYQDEANKYISIYGEGNQITSLIIELETSKERLGLDMEELDDSDSDLITSTILDRYHLDDSDDGLYVETSLFANIIYVDFYIDTEIVKDETLKALDLEFIKGNSYSQALENIKSSGMDCY